MGQRMTNKITKPRNLLRIEVSSELECLSLQLCSLKVQMDRLSRDPIGQPFLDDWMESENTCAYFGDSFLNLILPFANWKQNEGSEYYRAYVDPRFVLGACIKGFPEHIPQEKVSEKIKHYSTEFGSRDNACYIWYKDLGLFYAHEGKHRVAFMRAHNQPAIAAWVREASYPEPQRLLIIKPSDKRDEWLVLLDNRYLQILKRPRTSQRLLNAYGVKTLQWKELPSLPDEMLVRQEIYQRRLHRPPQTILETERTLDLEELREKSNHELEDKAVTHSALALGFGYSAPYQLAWKRYVIVSGSALVTGTILAFIDHSLFRYGGIALLGVGTGLVFALEQIRFRQSK